MNVGKYTYSEEEIALVEKSLGITFADRDRELLRTDNYTSLIEDLPAENGKKPGKLHLYRDKKGEVYATKHYRKETLLIPDVVAGKKLVPGEKQKLMDGQVIMFQRKKGNLYLNIDKDLNTITVRGEKEIGMPSVIGNSKHHHFDGYTLTDDDKIRLANGVSLPPKVLCGDNGYFLAEFSLSSDSKGYVFKDCETIPGEKVQEYIQRYNQQEKETEIKAVEGRGGDKKEERNMDSEFREAVSKRDFDKINGLAEEGYKPAGTEIKRIYETASLTESEKTAINVIFNIKEEKTGKERGEEEKLPEKPEKKVTIKKGEEKGNLIEQKSSGEGVGSRKAEKVGNLLVQGFRDM